MTAFTTTDRATWPELLTADHVAAIYQRRVGGLKKACQEHRFIPAPFQRRPYLWRRADVLRSLDGPSTPRPYRVASATARRLSRATDQSAPVARPA